MPEPRAADDSAIEDYEESTQTIKKKADDLLFHEGKMHKRKRQNNIETEVEKVQTAKTKERTEIKKAKFNATTKHEAKILQAEDDHKNKVKRRRPERVNNTPSDVLKSADAPLESAMNASFSEDRDSVSKTSTDLGHGCVGPHKRNHELDNEKKEGHDRHRKRHGDISSTIIVTGETEVRKAKKRKNRTPFPDPDDDTSLSEQSRKALSYAFQQFNRPKKWKFSKARQNWLLRNLWSDGMVPEGYIPLVLTYLANVRGGIREDLSKTCQEYLKPPREGDKATTTDTSILNTKKSRAQAILDVLTTSAFVPAQL